MNWYPCWNYRFQNYQSLKTTVKNLHQKIYLHNNLNGQSIRILFSNQYGQEVLHLDHMSIEIEDKVYPLTYQGNCRISLNPNQELYSDEIDIDIHAKEDIIIHLYIEENVITGYVGLNSQSMITIDFDGYIESGVLNRKFNSFVYFAVKAVEIKTKEIPIVITVFGDSLVQQGYWMNHLFYELYKQTEDVVVLNQGISGNRLLKDATSSSQLNSIFGEAGIKRFEKDIFERYQPDLVVFAEGINDFVHPGNGCPISELPTFEEMKDGYLKINNIIKHYRKSIVFITLTPFCNYDGIWNQEREDMRQQINQWLKKDMVSIDINSFLRDDIYKERLKDIYDGGDHLHFNEKAGKEIALHIVNKILHLIKKEG